MVGWDRLAEPLLQPEHMFPTTSADVDQVCTWVIFQTKSNRLIVVPCYFLLLWSGARDALFPLTLCVCLRVAAESIEWFIEDQAFALSYDFAPPPSPRPPASCHSFSVFRGVAGQAYWRGGGGAKSYDSENAWSSINHSILSAPTNRQNLIHNSARSHPHLARSHPQLCYISSTTR